MTVQSTTTTLPPTAPAPRSFAGQRVAVVGLGIEGRDALHLLRREGAEVTLVDDQPAAEILSRLVDHGLATPDADITSTADLELLAAVDYLVVSQGVFHGIPLLCAAMDRGIPIVGPMQLFLERWQARRAAPLIGITGSAGKTTTTTLVHRILETTGVSAVAGGNIGEGLLAQLPQLSPGTVVTAEISHAQLLRTTCSPNVAALLNLTPNHLDQFTWEQYRQLKQRIFAYQTPADRAILPFDEPLAAASVTPAEIARFGIGNPEPNLVHSGGIVAWSDGEKLYLRADDRDLEIMRASDLRIPGQHNLRNALAAIAITAGIAPPEAAAEVLRSFTGVAHRLEQVAVVRDVRYINDSIATTPERTLAGLRAIAGPIVLLLGGRDKRLPLEPLLGELEQGVRVIVTFGEAGPQWQAWLEGHGTSLAISVKTLEDAVPLAAELAHPGDAVLLSPAGTSFDQYPNFAARGDHFRSLVQDLCPDSAAAGEAEERA